MRYCNQCHHITQGEPLFCNFCGSSYDVKLCGSRHPNPRNAVVCSQCGSREFSQPAPESPLWVKPVLWLVSIFPGALLLLLSILFLVGVLNALLTNGQLRFQMVSAGLIIGMLWWAYMHLPHFLKGLFSTIWRKSKSKKER
jgi:hypothetical protein